MYSASSPGPSPMWYCRSPSGIAIRRSTGVFDAGVRVRQDLSLAQVAASLARNSGEDSPAFSRASSRVERACERGSRSGRRVGRLGAPPARPRARPAGRRSGRPDGAAPARRRRRVTATDASDDRGRVRRGPRCPHRAATDRRSAAPAGRRRHGRRRRRTGRRHRRRDGRGRCRGDRIAGHDDPVPGSVDDDARTVRPSSLHDARSTLMRVARAR